MKPTFSKKFCRSDIDRFRRFIPKTYRTMEKLAEIREGKPVRIRWPDHIEAMTPGEVRKGRRSGKGHGLYFPETRTVKINPGMNWLHIYLNFIHENLHHAIPKATEKEINRILVPMVCYEATGIIIRNYDGNKADVYYPP